MPDLLDPHDAASRHGRRPDEPNPASIRHNATGREAITSLTVRGFPRTPDIGDAGRPGRRHDANPLTAPRDRSHRMFVVDPGGGLVGVIGLFEILQHLRP
ncbi:hypothetical protein [Limnoglobus roseus]|uniref:CBS domain-containing protein n=1 Tax=Limnoglobus roseus TaxID=2598579 RepID=A0A5C1AMW8_9BACT|nr:hypothetical protein [Limnoglobus roseus]QEL20581.1 hypothetical protein PX52LOC_07686 [Limnoglobus roseus]